MALISRLFLVPKTLARIASIIERSRYRVEIRCFYSSAGGQMGLSADKVGPQTRKKRRVTMPEEVCYPGTVEAGALTNVVPLHPTRAAPVSRVPVRSAALDKTSLLQAGIRLKLDM
jgi:hypothetical protein